MPFDEDERPTIRYKGLPRRVASTLKKEDFELRSSGMYYSSVALAPTLAGQMGIEVRSRKEVICLNTKRRLLSCRIKTEALT